MNDKEKLKEAYEHWQDIYENGCSDPFHSDGTNLNLIRNHIKSYKQELEKELNEDQYPTIYYKELPIKVDYDYMAKSDEIEVQAKDYYRKCTSLDGWEDFNNAYELLDKNNLEQAKMRFFIEYVENLKLSIEEKDYVAMRRLNKSQIDMKELEESIVLFQSLDITGIQQISLFSM